MKIVILLFCIGLYLIATPVAVQAQEAASPILGSGRFVVSEVQEIKQSSTLTSMLRRWLGARGPTIIRPDPGTTFTVISSAYAPSPYQTDNTPCITAAGTRVRRGTVASNFLPLGTILDIDGEPYIVEDRMNARYGRAIDIFYLHTTEALEFGRRKLTVTILGYGEPGQSLQAYNNLSQEAEPSTEGEPNLFDRLGGRLTYLQRSFGQFIGIRKPAQVNQYDVDCLNES